ncbi:MAG: DNA methyltransferase [Candidatus Doudnabacteria bacterium]|nr:DNA methyltransferase [Candidatus Doudnabacteria bacterium]
MNDSMRYAFVLGRVYTLSVAELAAVLERPDTSLGLAGGPVKILEASEEILIIETEKPLNAERLQKKLGGVIKILEVVDVVKKREQDSLNFSLKHFFKPSVLKKQFFKDYKGKSQFGVSVYILDGDLLKRPQPQQPRQGQKPMGDFGNIFSEPKRLGMMIKNALTETGLSCRLVLPEFNSLSLASVVVTKNLLLQKGAEICILAAKDKVFVSKTLTVQDFEDYGRRDYQRPARDEKQGMIPPKVAQIMINLSGCKSGETILDPFCGIGTLVQEGLLLGFRMIGSDINKIAIKGSEQNLEWFRNRYKIAPGKYGVEVSDACKVSDLIEKSKSEISGIVTEGTLGPIYSQYPRPEEIVKNFKDLTALYTKSFKEFSKFLPKQAKIIMCLPAYKQGRYDYQMFPGLDFAAELGYNLVDIIFPTLAKNLKFLKLTSRNTAIYDRKDQIVAREIVVFEKN